MRLNEADAKTLLEHFRAREAEVLALTRALVETESPSGDVEGSRAVVDLIMAEAQSIACVSKVKRIESPNYGEHVCVRAFKGQSTGNSILLIGHTDTVHPRGSLAERPCRAEGERLYGPGIFDMKANCAMALEALRACAAFSDRINCEVVLLLTCDEETGSETGRALIEAEARRASNVLVLEPPASGGRVKTGRKGTGMYTLEVQGRAAHAGLEPEKGASAILELARQIERIDALHNLERGTTLNVGVIQGGTRSNVVAAAASAEIDVRFTTQDEAERINRELNALKPVDERVQLLMRGDINRPPLERNEKVLALFERAREVAAALDFELGEAQVGGASDGNFVGALGVPVLDGLGIDGDGAHANHEHINVNDVARRGALLAGLILSLS